MVGFLYGVFGYLVFPRYGDRLYDDEEHRKRIRLHWLVSANVSGLALLGGVALLYAGLGLSALWVSSGAVLPPAPARGVWRNSPTCCANRAT